MKSILLSLVAGLAFALATSAAQAGGGSKPNSTILVKNNSGSRIAVVVDPSTSITNLIGSGDVTLTTSQLNQFKAAGGRIVNDGGATAFAVKSGAHVISVAEVNTTTGNVSTVNQFNVTTQKGKTVQVSAADDGSGTVTLTQKPL